MNLITSFCNRLKPTRALCSAASLIGLLLAATPVLQAQQQPGEAGSGVRTVAVAPLQVPPSLAQALKTPAEREALQLFADLVHQDVIASLTKVPGLQVVQRQDLSKILDEQNLGQSGNVSAETAARVGRLLGANILMVVDLRQFDFMRRETRSVAINRDIVTVSLDAAAYLNSYDTSTGALIAAVSSSGKAVDTQQYFINSQQQGGFNRTAITEAARDVAGNLVSSLSTSLFPPRVVAVTGKQVTLSRGTGYFDNGDLVDLLYVGNELKDPDTGVSLGREEVLIGQGKVIRVSPQTAILTLVEDNGVAVGQIARKAGAAQ